MLLVRGRRDQRGREGRRVGRQRGGDDVGGGAAVAGEGLGLVAGRARGWRAGRLGAGRDHGGVAGGGMEV